MASVRGNKMHVGLSILALSVAMPAVAQESVTLPPIASVPLSDTDCAPARQQSVQTPVTNGPAPCTVDGTRTVTVISQTSAPVQPGSPFLLVNGTYSVDFNGNLMLDGIPFTTNPANPGFSFPAHLLFPNLATVNVSATYQGTQAYAYAPAFGQSPIDPATLGQFRNVTNLVSQLNSINVSTNGQYELTDEATGTTYLVSLSTANPTAVANNSVNFGGSFSSTDGGRIVFGSINGAASLITAPTNNQGQYLRTPATILDGNGVPMGAYLSPWQLQYAMTPVVQTLLDENGLITPTISVTDGINMNNSRLINLAMGVDPNDAVTKGQLDAALAALAAGGAGGGNVVGNMGSGAQPVATGDGAVAGGSGSTANGNGAIALGLGNQANGNGAVAIGDPNIATGVGAVAIGADNTATGDGAVAIGNLNVANGLGAIAIGNGANAVGDGNIALGLNSLANGANSVAIGAGSIANDANTVSFGSAGFERRLTNVANGTAATDAVNRGQLDLEAAARVAGDLALQNAINAETLARIAAVNQLQLNIDAEATTRAAADIALNNAINTEATTRAAADVVLQANIDAEATTRAAADTVLANAINSEAATRAAADTVLANAITSEAATRAAADTTLANAITSEATTRAANDTILANAITDEATVRAANDTVLANAITSEATTRAANDTVLANAITTEVMTRSEQYLQVSQRLALHDSQLTQLTTGLASEAQARLAADVALSQRIDVVTMRLDQVDARLNLMDDHIASSTAVATAMSGNAFLPDMRFNLTANVATYDGAHAGAIQMGFLVSRHVAVNAGVASGFNRNGRTAARAGVTFGW